MGLGRDPVGIRGPKSNLQKLVFSRRPPHRNRSGFMEGQIAKDFTSLDQEGGSRVLVLRIVEKGLVTSSPTREILFATIVGMISRGAGNGR